MSVEDRLAYWKRRARDEWRIHIEERDAEHSREWAREALAEERRLRDRLTFVYGVAIQYGATHDELRGPE